MNEERKRYHAEIEATKSRALIGDLLNDIAAEFPYPIADMQRTLKNWIELFGNEHHEIITAAKARLFDTYEPYGKFPRTKHFNEALDFTRRNLRNVELQNRIEYQERAVMFAAFMKGNITEDAAERLDMIKSAEKYQDIERQQLAAVQS